MKENWERSKYVSKLRKIYLKAQKIVDKCKQLEIKESQSSKKDTVTPY